MKEQLQVFTRFENGPNSETEFQFNCTLCKLWKILKHKGLITEYSEITWKDN